jgi:hypothetical protein
MATGVRPVLRVLSARKLVVQAALNAQGQVMEGR